MLKTLTFLVLLDQIHPTLVAVHVFLSRIHAQHALQLADTALVLTDLLVDRLCGNKGQLGVGVLDDVLPVLLKLGLVPTVVIESQIKLG